MPLSCFGAFSWFISFKDKEHEWIGHIGYWQPFVNSQYTTKLYQLNGYVWSNKLRFILLVSIVVRCKCHTAYHFNHLHYTIQQIEIHWYRCVIFSIVHPWIFQSIPMFYMYLCTSTNNILIIITLDYIVKSESVSFLILFSFLVGFWAVKNPLKVYVNFSIYFYFCKKQKF